MVDIQEIKLGGIRDMLRLLNLLDEKDISTRLDYVQNDRVTVSASLVGVRIEVDFFQDRVDCRTFEGSEMVEDDQERLFGLIRG